MLSRRSPLAIAVIVVALFPSEPVRAIYPYDYNCLNNPYGAGSPYKWKPLQQ